MSNRKFQDIIFKNCGPRLPIEKVERFEKSIGFKLPDDYRCFLCEINGGTSIIRAFRCLGDPPPTFGKRYIPDYAKQVEEQEKAAEKKIQEQFGDKLGEMEKILKSTLGSHLEKFVSKMSRPPFCGPAPNEEEEFFLNSFQPRVVREFYALRRSDIYCCNGCVGDICRKVTLHDTPDVRSLIPVADTADGLLFQNRPFSNINVLTKDYLFLSINRDHFGYIYNGKFNTQTLRSFLPDVSGFGEEDQPLAELEDNLVAKSFSEFLAGLQFAKTELAEGYEPSRAIRSSYIFLFNDMEKDKNLPIEEASPIEEEKPKKKIPKPDKFRSPKEFVDSLKLQKSQWEGGYEWDGRIRLIHWIDFIERDSTRVRLHITSEDKDEIPQSVYEALRYTVDNQEKLKEIVLQAAVKQMQEWEYGGVEEPDDLLDSMNLEGIHIVIPPDGKPVQIGYVLPCEYSDEHGFGVLLCGDEAIDAGFDDILDYYHE